MVRCSSGALYTGITVDPGERVRKHNSGKGAKAVRALGLPVKLAYLKEMGDKSRALQSEAFIKSLTKERKEKLIKISKVNWKKDK